MSITCNYKAMHIFYEISYCSHTDSLACEVLDN